jgi:AcrR family transcriptional regulator
LAERDLIVAELKRSLKQHGLTYAMVARSLGLSLPTVKRLFAGGDFSLARVERICELAKITLRELLERAHERSTPANQLTLTQEREIVADPKLLFVTWLVLNRTAFEDITREYRLSEREVLRCFLKLDRLKVLELQPHNRVRLLVDRHFSWRAGGPVQRYIHEKLLREFLGSHFTGTQDEFFFHGSPMSDAVRGQLKRVLQNASRECLQLLERDRTPFAQRNGTAFVVALRPWVYSGFGEFARSGNDAASAPARPAANR